MSESISSLPSVFKRRHWPAIATFVSVICGSLAYLIVTPPMYEATLRIMVNDKQLSVSDLGRDLATLPNAPGGNPIATQAELARSQRVLEQARAQILSQGTYGLPESKLKIEKLKKELKVSIVPATNILEISYRSQNRLLSAGLLNAVSEAMVKENAEAIRAEAGSVRNFLEGQVPIKRAQLAQVEVAESQYKKSSGIVSFTEQTESLVESLTNLEDQERALTAELKQAKARENSLRRTTDAGTLKNTYASVRIGQDEELQRLRARLADLDSQIIVLRSRFKDDHPTLLPLLQQREATRTLYNRRVSRLLPKDAPANPPANIASDQLSQALAARLILSENERSALESRLDVVRTSRANLQARLNQLPAREQALTELTRRREEAAASLQLLQRRLEEARIAEAQLASNIRIVDRAEPPTVANWPRKSIVLVISTAAGILLAIGVVLLLEVLDGTLHNATEIEKLVKLPVLSDLPVLPTEALSLEQPELFLDNPRLVESYRTLLKTIEFRSIKDLRIVVVSSSLSGEGKTVVVSHLAAVSAMLFRRTLIVDADLRWPCQHNLFNLAAQPGLTDVIDGDFKLAAAVQQTSIKHLYVLTSGEPRQHPSQFLESPRMRTLLAEAAAHYDLVIVDTPPLTSCVDATTLSRGSDGLLLVARPNLTPRDVLLRTVSELTDNHVHVLGVTINGMTAQTEKYYRYPIQGFQPPVKQLNRR